MMRRLLMCLSVAAVLSACGTVLPTPSPVPTPPTPSPSPASPTPGPTTALPYVLDCGPLSGDRAACDAAVQAALGLMPPTVSDVKAVHVEAPAPRPCATGRPANLCRSPTVVVKVYAGSSHTLADVVPLIQTASGWVSLAQIR